MADMTTTPEEKLAALLEGITNPNEITRIVSAFVKKMMQQEKPAPKPRRKSTKPPADPVFYAKYPRVVEEQDLTKHGYKKNGKTHQELCRNCGEHATFDTYYIRGVNPHYRCRNCGWMGKITFSKGCSMRCLCVGGACQIKHVPYYLRDIVPEGWHEKHPITGLRNNVVPKKKLYSSWDHLHVSRWS